MGRSLIDGLIIFQTAGNIIFVGLIGGELVSVFLKESCIFAHHIRQTWQERTKVAANADAFAPMILEPAFCPSNQFGADALSLCGWMNGNDTDPTERAILRHARQHKSDRIIAMDSNSPFDSFTSCWNNVVSNKTFIDWVIMMTGGIPNMDGV